MVTGDSPAVARRRLRLALRRAREGKGLTQAHVAEKLEWSLSKVTRIENGDVNVSNTDLKALLELFEVTEAEHVEKFLDDGRAARRRGWWDDPKHREHLTPGTLQLLQFESEASAIRVFQPSLVPGLLQTRAYAETVMGYLNDDLSEAERATRLEVRMQRPAQVFRRPDPPKYFVVLDESALLREVGGSQVMADQLREVLALISEPNITIRVMPFSEGAFTATLGPFTIFDLGDEENAILYRESVLGDEISHNPADVQRRRDVFEKMWKISLSVEASVRLIEARAAAMLSALDMRRPTG
jgi:transcriptional regulator with XRE-family HTH domain